MSFRPVTRCMMFIPLILVGCAPFTAANSRTRSISTMPQRGREACQRLIDEGHGLWKNGNLPGAVQAFLRAANADHTSASSYNNLAIVLGQKGEFRQSIAAFRQATRLSPEATEPHVNLGNLYCSIGWFDEAIEEYELALSLGGEDLDILGRLAYVHSTLRNRLDLARPYLKRLAVASSNPQWQSWATGELVRSRE